MKNNKVSFFYITTSVLLFLTLLIGGAYGVYLSIGLSFVRSNASNVAGDVAGNVANVSNVSYGGSVNFSPSMTGVIVLSIGLIVLALFDFVALIKQIVFFKQFKVIDNACITKKIESKTKSKSSIIVFVFILDVLSVIAGIVGVFINIRSMAGGNISWILYFIDGLISLLALASIVLLIIKLKKIKKHNKETKSQCEVEQVKKKEYEIKDCNFDIDKIEYALLKIKHLKASRVISDEEYKIFRDKIMGCCKPVKEMVELESVHQNKK